MNEPNTGPDPSGPTKYLALRLGQEEYGVDILKVQEIRGCESVTRIPNAPESFRGVINLRGVIVPIIDLRIALNADEATYDALTAVVVLNLGLRTFGVVVDGVSDVVTLLPEQVRPAPELGHGHAADYITGIGTLAERTLIIVDVAAMLASAGLDFPQPIAA
ncbi:chemotaxis protein CheW [Noviherbaspirillum aerium]|uniref:chemotaxis protein CheW n=1 Tax=Noviherbaspirillum aerium TaxID=2588497 RepID=UPI00124CCCF8|nr:chemotaxis protein CheW [Noviherbaspirillum aerium]